MNRIRQAERAAVPVVATMLILALTISLAVGVYTEAFGLADVAEDDNKDLADTPSRVEVQSDGTVRITESLDVDAVVVKNKSGDELARLDSVGDIYRPPEYLTRINVLAQKGSNELLIASPQIGETGVAAQDEQNTLEEPACGINYDFSGGNGTASDPYRIDDVQDLQCITDQPSKHYILTSTIDASHTQEWNNGSGFVPMQFDGSLDGRGYAIDDLYINRTDENYVGMFTRLDGNVTNLGMRNADVSGNQYVGILAGETPNNDFDPATRVYVEGRVEGEDYVAGMIGDNKASGEINRSFAGVDVRLIIDTGDETVGGIAASYSGNSKVNKSYWDADRGPTPSATPSKDGQALRQGEMTGEEAPDYMTGFDFQEQWYTQPGWYPELR